MKDDEVERARITAEARDAVAGRPPAAGASRLEALKRYLASEQRHEQHRLRQDRRRTGE